MMKIHSAQNLSSIREKLSTNKNMLPMSEVRLNYSEQMRKQRFSMPDTYNSNYVSFKGKKEIVRVVNKLSKETVEKEKFNKKNLKPGLFEKLLDLMEHEVLIQSILAGIVCAILRPTTIMALPKMQDGLSYIIPVYKRKDMSQEQRKLEKENNMYAAGHSIASGIVGFFSTLLISTPFSKGGKYAQKYLISRLKPENIKELYPHVNMESIKDASGKIKDMDKWLDLENNKFSPDYKKVISIALPRLVNEVGEDTLKKLGADVDLAAMKGKSVNDWVTRSGEKLKFKLKDMIIAVKEEGMDGAFDKYKHKSMRNAYKNTNFFSLLHIDEKFLQEVYPELDIKSIQKDGKRLHTDFWKNKDGSQFKLNMDDLHISSYNETCWSTPLYTGDKRYTKKGVAKYISYQENNKCDNYTEIPERLGTAIKQEYLETDKINDIHNKFIVWLPDFVTRIPIAALTIALIPKVLKHGFGLEKHKAPKIEDSVAKDNNTQRKEVA